AEEILRGELALSPEVLGVFEALIEARRAILERIKDLDRRIRAIARESRPVRLLMTAPGVGPITALSVVSAFDDAGRFRSSSSAGAYLGLAPRRCESGETSRQGRISRRGDKMTRTHLSEAANAILTRKIGGDALREWGLRIAGASGYRKAKGAVARKLAVIPHAMWKTETPFIAAE
ncbi:MAG: IS110 family transposase, partial [Pseudomonadota bacterium]